MGWTLWIETDAARVLDDAWANVSDRLAGLATQVVDTSWPYSELPVRLEPEATIVLPVVEPFVEAAARLRAVQLAERYPRPGDAPTIAIPLRRESPDRDAPDGAPLPATPPVFETRELAVPLTTAAVGAALLRAPAGTLAPRGYPHSTGQVSGTFTFETAYCAPGGAHDAGWLFARWCR
ncbi:MAG: hypothetical protein AAGA90_20505 [Actinomycetota bacterium]